MTFAEWRKREGLSLRAAATRISETGGGSLTGECIRLLESGTRSPTIATADVISRGTGGEVTRMDWPEEKPETTTKTRGGA